MYKLEKPYNDKQYADFVCEHQGLENYEDETGFYFLAENEIVQDGEIVINLNYEQEQAEILKQKQKQDLQKQIDEIDKKRVRAVCEPSMKTETQSWLEYYNAEIQAIRQVMATL